MKNQKIIKSRLLVMALLVVVPSLAAIPVSGDPVGNCPGDFSLVSALGIPSLDKNSVDRNDDGYVCGLNPPGLLPPMMTYMIYVDNNLPIQGHSAP